MWRQTLTREVTLARPARRRSKADASIEACWTEPPPKDGRKRGGGMPSTEDETAPENGETAGVGFPFHFGVDGIEDILHRRPRRLGLFGLSLVLGGLHSPFLEGSNKPRTFANGQMFFFTVFIDTK